MKAAQVRGCELMSLGQRNTETILRLYFCDFLTVFSYSKFGSKILEMQVFAYLKIISSLQS